MLGGSQKIWSAAGMLLWLMLASVVADHAQAAVCPEWTTPACIEEIRKYTNDGDFGKARDEADRQCWEDQDFQPEASLTARYLLNRTSGCFHLFELERLLGRHERAFSARERARRLAAVGCESGQQSLCEFMSGFAVSALRSLLAELRYDLSRKERQPPPVVGFGEIELDRNLNRDLRKILHDEVAKAWLKATGSPVIAPQLKSHGQRLHAALKFDGVDYELELVVRRPDGFRVWSGKYQTSDIRDRYRYFGFGTLGDANQLHHKRLDEYLPAYKFTFGGGLMRLPSVNGNMEDASRFTVEIRAMERFHERRSEFGLLVGYHLASSALVEPKEIDLSEVEGEEEPPAEPEPDPAEDPNADPDSLDDLPLPTDEELGWEGYKTSFAVYGMYSRIFWGSGPQGYDSLRWGINIGAGGYFTESFFTGSARLGADLYLGRRWMLSGSVVWVDGPAVQYGREVLKAEAVFGGGIVMSLNL